MRKRSHKLRNAVAGLGALIAAALLWLSQCGGGLGVLADGADWVRDRAGVARSDEAPPDGDAGAAIARCDLRLDRNGLSLAGRPVERDEAVKACARAGAADLLVTGDARYGDFEALHDALEGAGVEVYVR